MICLVRSFNRYTDVIGLFLGQFGQFHADTFQMQAGYFFIQVFRQAIYADFVRFLPEIHLSQYLVGE